MRRLSLALAALALLGVAAGCGSQGVVRAVPQTVVGTVAKAAAEPTPPPLPKPDPAKGKAVFASAGCGNCHTLAAAHSSGTVGPNLDDRKPSYLRATTRLWFGKGLMPPFGKSGTLTKQQVADVAAYVVKSTGGTP